MSGRFLTPHALYEAEHPDEPDMAQRYEQHRRAQHLRTRGTLDGYVPEREFPCPGSLRVVEEHESGIATIACDTCPFMTTGRLARHDDDRRYEPEPERAEAPF